MNRRLFIASAAAGVAAFAQGQDVPEAIKALKPMTGGIHPIADDERRARIEKARGLMRENRIDAVVIGGGSSLFYFTGVRSADASWVLPASGAPVWIAAQEPKGALAGEFRQLKEGDDESRLIAQALTDRRGNARVGIEERVPFGLFDGIRKHAAGADYVSADPVTVGCRVIKSPAEIALMQRANDITIACYKAALANLREGMTQRELSANISAGFRNLGVGGNAMAIFGKYTAFPHGSIQPQQLREGDMVLIDDGCSVEGYQSDITRTTVFGKPTARQRQVWDIERKAQDAALAAAKPGATCESVDAAARKVITDAGFGPGYQVPGLPHRTGHGIGLDGHEWTNLVKGNTTKIRPGMCFSNEPTIAIYGEFGVRLEDCMYVTESGARMFTKQSPAIDQPFG
jgi:Xaa-Pro dipeptidase